MVDSLSGLSPLREAFLAEIPGLEFDDLLLQHFASILECCDDANIAEEWAPYLVNTSAAADGASAQEVSLAILNRLRGDGSDPDWDVQGLTDFLQKLRLHNYEAEARKWCRKLKIYDVAGILVKWEAFSDEANLKRLDKKRLREYVENGGTIAMDKAPSFAEKLKGRLGTFGHPPYSIMESIGSGVTAVVHRCLRVEHGKLRTYAVKIISLKECRMLVNCAEHIAKIKREILIMQKVKHPNIARLYDVVDENAACHKGISSHQDKLYLVMGYVNGGDLFDYLRKTGRQNERDAAFMFTQLVYALKCLQEEGIVHRDLKPENILVVNEMSPDGPVVCLTDFGCSRIIDEGKALTKAGTVKYMAPEVLDDWSRSKGYDEKVDLWSLGVVLYVMLTGDYPFGGNTEEEIWKNVRNGTFSFKPGRTPSPEAQDIIKKLITVIPSRRLSLEGCLSHNWLKGHAP